MLIIETSGVLYKGHKVPVAASEVWHFGSELPAAPTGLCISSENTFPPCVWMKTS